MPTKPHAMEGDDQALYVCPNPDCDRFNQFKAGNLSVCKWMGKNKGIRRRDGGELRSDRIQSLGEEFGEGRTLRKARQALFFRTG